MEKKDWKKEFHKKFVQHYYEDDIYNFYGYGDDAPQMGSGKEEVDKVVAFISQELDKAREEVERKFVEKYHKRGKEMNVPYSEEDGKEFWQGYKEGYNQGLKDMIVDTYYLDKEFELKLKQ